MSTRHGTFALARGEPDALTEHLPKLFASAFAQSKNAMVLVDEKRRHVDANGAYVRLLGYPRRALIGRPIHEFVADGPIASPAEWAAAIEAGQFTGEAELLCADGGRVGVQWAATAEQVTGRYLVLVVALSTSRWGARFRRTMTPASPAGALTPREHEIVRLISLGSTGPEIADQLQITHATVRTHVRNSMTKVDARSRAHLVAKALGDGLILS